MALGIKPHSGALAVLVLATMALSYPIIAFVFVVTISLIYVPLLEADLNWLQQLEKEGVGAKRIRRCFFFFQSQHCLFEIDTTTDVSISRKKWEGVSQLNRHGNFQLWWWQFERLGQVLTCWGMMLWYVPPCPAVSLQSYLLTHQLIDRDMLRIHCCYCCHHCHRLRRNIKEYCGPWSITLDFDFVTAPFL